MWICCNDVHRYWIIRSLFPHDDPISFDSDEVIDKLKCLEIELQSKDQRLKSEQAHKVCRISPPNEGAENNKFDDDAI